MTDQQVRNTLVNLYRMAEAGEKGYATAAAVMPNPGLKVLLTLYARQRADFKEEILAELHRMGGEVRPGHSVAGMIHRGRVNIFAAMSIDRESQAKTVLKEVAIGERAAVRAYASALTVDLPQQTRTVVERQFGEIRGASDQIQQLRGSREQKMLVHLYRNEDDAATAIRNLKQAGFRSDSIARTALQKAALYEGHGATVAETVLSGAFGGALWGGLMGVFAGLGVLQNGLFIAGLRSWWFTWIVVALAFALMGAFISSVLSLFIGLSISGADTYQVSMIHPERQVLVQVLTDPSRAGQAERILDEAVPQATPSMLNASA